MKSDICHDLFVASSGTLPTAGARSPECPGPYKKCLIWLTFDLLLDPCGLASPLPWPLRQAEANIWSMAKTDIGPLLKINRHMRCD